MEIKIKNIAKVTNGKSDVKDAVNNGKYLFFDRSIIVKRSDKFLFDSEAIIIPGEDSRMIFEPRYFNGKFNLHQRCYVIYDFEKDYNAKYLYYKLKTLTKHFANVFVGSTVPSLRLDHITDLVIDFPNITIQQKIASFLSALDSKIELNNKINTELETMAKMLYDYWFVQYDFPDEDGNPYKSSGGKMFWNKDLKKDIPEDWEVKSLADITDLSNESVNPFNYPEKEFKHYSIPNFDKSGTYGIEKGYDIKSNKFVVTQIIIRLIISTVFLLFVYYFFFQTLLKTF
jgi:restriction endonuclease S subunit